MEGGVAAAAVTARAVIQTPAQVEAGPERSEKLVEAWQWEKGEGSRSNGGSDAKIMTVSDKMWTCGNLDDMMIFLLRAERGFCILGESCPYDHGLDPVVIDGNINPYARPPPGLPSIGVPTLPPPPPPGMQTLTNKNEKPVVRLLL